MLTSTLKWGALIGLATYLVVDVALTAIGLLAFGSGSGGPDGESRQAHTGLRQPLSAALRVLGCRLLCRARNRALGRWRAGRRSRWRHLRRAHPGLYTRRKRLWNVVQARRQVLWRPSSSSLVTAVLYLGVAALMGWLGGRPGAQRSPLRVKAAARAPEAGESTPLSLADLLCRLGRSSETGSGGAASGKVICAIVQVRSAPSPAQRRFA